MCVVSQSEASAFVKIPDIQNCYREVKQVVEKPSRMVYGADWSNYLCVCTTKLLSQHHFISFRVELSQRAVGGFPKEHLKEIKF